MTRQRRLHQAVRRRVVPSPPVPATSADDAALALGLFDNTFGGPSWAAWRAWLKAVLGLPLSEPEAAISQQCTARTTTPTATAREA